MIQESGSGPLINGSGRPTKNTDPTLVQSYNLVARKTIVKDDKKMTDGLMCSLGTSVRTTRSRVTGQNWRVPATCLRRRKENI
jgi:hypothetical protein